MEVLVLFWALSVTLLGVISVIGFVAYVIPYWFPGVMNLVSWFQSLPWDDPIWFTGFCFVAFLIVLLVPLLVLYIWDEIEIRKAMNYKIVGYMSENGKVKVDFELTEEVNKE